MPKILIVEDSADNMKLFRALLIQRGHEVIGLSPGKDGFALLEEIRGSAHRHLRVVALTAHAMSGDRERAQAAGFDGYITKPIDIRRFPDTVERVLAGETFTAGP